MKSEWLYFVAGMVIGAVSGAFAYKKYAEYKRLKQDDDIFMDEYEDIADAYKRHDQDFQSEVNPEDGNCKREDGVLPKEEREEIKEKLKRNWDKTTNYASMYNGDHPMDSDEDEENPLTEEEEQAVEDALDATVDHINNAGKKPKIISYDAVADLPSYIDQENLFYYKVDDILANESEEVLDVETFVGDALDKYGFRDNDEREIYVMNFALDTCYTVTKVDGSLSDL